MPACPIPDDETERLESLHALNILDTPKDDQYNFIVNYIAESLSAPFALATLIDKDRCWFKSSRGVPIPTRQVPRSMSFCGHAIHAINSPEPSGRVFAVSNLSEDPRFSDHPLVLHYPKLRSYLGFILQGPSHKNIGSLSIIDMKPREFKSDEIEVITEMGLMMNNLIFEQSRQ